MTALAYNTESLLDALLFKTDQRKKNKLVPLGGTVHWLC